MRDIDTIGRRSISGHMPCFAQIFRDLLVLYINLVDVYYRRYFKAV